MQSDPILILEDERLVAQNLATVLKQAGYTVSFIADNLTNATDFFKDNPVSLIISDINLHGEHTGPEIVRALRAIRHVPVIYLTAYSETQIVEDALNTEPVAYVLKPFTDRQLLVALRMALKPAPECNDQILPKPTPREIEIIKHLSEGLNSKKIGEELFISEHTVKTHRRNLLKRYQLESSSELITLAIKQQWIRL
jgi:DNA-binding NarL/FixJ family response regulator